VNSSVRAFVALDLDGPSLRCMARLVERIRAYDRYRSVLGPGGARYVPLDRFEFTA